MYMYVFCCAALGELILADSKARQKESKQRACCQASNSQSSMTQNTLLDEHSMCGCFADSLFPHTAVMCLKQEQAMAVVLRTAIAQHDSCVYKTINKS